MLHVSYQTEQKTFWLLVKIGQSEDGQSRGGHLRSNLRAGARGESKAEMTWPSALHVNNNT